MNFFFAISYIAMMEDVSRMKVLYISRAVMARLLFIVKYDSVFIQVSTNSLNTREGWWEGERMREGGREGGANLVA